jgi:hypothetical protein
MERITMNEQRTGTIRTALQQLDPANTDHWTDDGLPKTGVVQKIAKDTTISRKDIQDAWPGFEKPAPEPQTETAPDFAEAQPVDAAGNIGSTETGVAPPVEAGGREVELGDAPMTADEIRYELEQRVVDAEELLLDARKRHAQAARDIPVLADQVTAVRKELNRQFPPMSAQDNVREYIDTQNALRAARAAQYQGRVAPTPLDASFGNIRGNTRGNAGGPNQLPSSGWVNPRRPVMGADGNLIKGADGRPAMPMKRETRQLGPLGRPGVARPVRSGPGVPATGPVRA